MNEKLLDLDIKLKPVLKYKWGNEEGFRNFKKGYEKGFNEAQEILIKEIKQRIRKAVQGLLEEIKLECKPYDMLYGEVGNRKLSFEQIKQIIEKWFPDVFKEVKEDGLD